MSFPWSGRICGTTLLAVGYAGCDICRQRSRSSGMRRQISLSAVTITTCTKPELLASPSTSVHAARFEDFSSKMRKTTSASFLVTLCHFQCLGAREVHRMHLHCFRVGIELHNSHSHHSDGGTQVCSSAVLRHLLVAVNDPLRECRQTITWQLNMLLRLARTRRQCGNHTVRPCLPTTRMPTTR